MLEFEPRQAVDELRKDRCGYLDHCRAETGGSTYQISSVDITSDKFQLTI